jgi:SAM-dependent methyltransferase
MSDSPRDARERWERVYAEKFMTMWHPNEDIIRFCARLVRRRLTFDEYEVKRSVRRVLDLGCGNGRRALFFARQGLAAVGVDVSLQAVRWAREWCRREGVGAAFGVGDVTRLPYRDGAFDVVVSHGVLDHMLMEDARRAATEVWRVLAPSGLFYCDLRSVEDFESGRGREVAPHTRVIDAGFEEGLVQHFFTYDEIPALIDGLFRVLYVECNDNRLGPEFHRKYSRWVVAAERVP